MAESRSLKEKVYHEILNGIFSSEFKPNQILTEKELIDRFGYSKSPIREALIALCHEGVLKNIPRCGYEVVRLTREDVDEIMQFRLLLERGLLEAGWRNFTENDFQKLDELNRLCNLPESDLLMHWRHNMNFHLYLISCAGNSFAYQELEKSMNILWRAYAQFYWNRWNNFVIPSDMRMHKQILDALKKKDIAAALRLLEADFSDFVM